MRELGPAAYVQVPDPLPGTVSTTVVAQRIDGPEA
jgi:hypothetical protein